MGLLLTKEDARDRELDTLINEAWEQYCDLEPGSAAERAAGVPDMAGSFQALQLAVFLHRSQLLGEQRAVLARASALRMGNPDVPPMPAPTPPLQMVPVSPAGASPALMPCGSCVEPSTPLRGSSSPVKRLRGKGSSEEAAAAGGAEGGEAVPSLAGGGADVAAAGRSAAGVHHRAGQQQEIA